MSIPDFEKHSDAALEKGADFADDRTGGSHDEHIEKGQDFLDDKIGGGDTSDPQR